MAKSMDFPGKPKKYSDNLNQAYELELPTSYVAVPGAQGERGEKGLQGDRGPEGQEGKQGPKGDPGKPGKDGKDGKNGESMLSPSGQKIGWARYSNLNQKNIILGATRGDDGWVSLGVDGKGENNEEFLPENNVSLYNPETQKINLKGLKVGSIVTIRYDISLTTFANNTEVWFKTSVPSTDIGPVTFSGNLKYQFEYDLSLQHTLFLENDKMRTLGAISQILTDNDASMKIKALYIYVS
jgi:hypothetical protein